MIKPMKAFKYAPDKITYPIFMQPKLNGLRAVCEPGRSCTTYNLETWNPSIVEHMFSALTGLPWALDGEMYKHGMSLQAINSRIGVNRLTPHPEGHLIKFNIFDVVVDAPFYRRLLVLNRLAERFADHPAIAVVPTVEANSKIEADYWYNEWRNISGFEGAMYRFPDAHYGFSSRCGNKDNRWNCILKRKEMDDLDAVVIGFNEEISQEGEPKNALGSFQLKAANGAVFDAGSGLTREQRTTYWQRQHELLGRTVKVRYEMLSDAQVPLKPIIDFVDYIP